jgi:virulence-associated protein VagC
MLVIRKGRKSRIEPDRQRSNAFFGVGKRVTHEDFMKDIQSMKQIGHAIASMEKG